MLLTPVEWLSMGLTSWFGEDNQCRIHVMSTQPDGVEVSMGWIDKIIFYQDPSMARKMIDKIKFCRRS